MISSTAKLLILNGAAIDRSNSTELIDLVNPELQCESLPVFPATSETAGGLLKSSNGSYFPIVCTHDGFQNDAGCYVVRHDSFDKLADDSYSQGFFQGSVVLNNNILWMTGGFTSNQTDTTYTDRTVVYNFGMNQTVLGPRLLEPLAYQCTVSVYDMVYFLEIALID